MSRVPLRPLEFGEILDHAIELYRRNLATLLGIYAVAAVPYIALSTPLSLGALAAPGEAGAAPDLGSLGVAALGGLGLFVAYGVFVSPVICGAMTLAVSERFLGRPAGIADAYRRVGRHLGPLLVCQGLLTLPLLAVLLAVIVGCVLLAVLAFMLLGLDPGQLGRTTVAATALCVPALGLVVLAFLTWFGWVPAAVVLEGRGFGALRRSVALVRGQARRVFALLGVLGLMVMVMAAYVRLPTQLLAGAAGLGNDVRTAQLGAVAMQLGILLVDPVRLVGMVLVYYDLRVRQEGFDLALLADELAGGPPAGDG